MCSQSSVVYSLEYCYHQKNQCHFNSGLQTSFTVCCFLQSWYVNVSLCLFKIDLPDRKACISWRQKSDVFLNFSAILLLMLLSLKTECYHFPLLPSYLTVAVMSRRLLWKADGWCCIGFLLYSPLQLFPWSLLPQTRRNHRSRACASLVCWRETLCAYIQSEYGVPGWRSSFWLT